MVDTTAATMSPEQKDTLEKQAMRAVCEARSVMILGKGPGNLEQFGDPPQMAFFAVLSMKLMLRADWGVQTMATDGRFLLFNPKWTLSLSPEERLGVVCHEVYHCVYQHPSRRQGREKKRWNIAGDLAINGEMKKLGFVLPSKGCVPGEGKFASLPVGKSADWYYPAIQTAQQQQQGGGKGQGEGEPGEEEGDDPGGNGEVRDAGDGSPAQMSESAADWKVAVSQAARQARMKGRLPSGLDRLVEETLKPKVNWREILREFVTRHARNDYSWMPPSRRYIHMDLYMPGVRSEELGELVVAVDTSGSIGRKMLAEFATEIQTLVEEFNASVTILYCDAAINHVQMYACNDGPLRLEAKGGGGTSHVPVFEWIDQNAKDAPCVVCLTDLYTDFPEKTPGYPVLWCVYENPRGKAPFGQTVHVEA